MASLVVLRRCEDELLVASSPSVAVRIVRDSARFLRVELPAPVVGYPWHARDVGQSRAVPGKRRVGPAVRNGGQGQRILGKLGSRIADNPRAPPFHC